MSNARRPVTTPPRPSGPATRRAAAASARRRTPLLVGAVLVVIVAAVVIAVAVSGGGGGKSSVNQTAAVTATGATLPQLPQNASALVDPATDPAVGKPAPALAGTDFAGNAVSVPAAGKPTVVLFVAHWCPHCQKEVPLVQQWRNAGNGAGVEWRTVSTAVNANNGNYPPSSWLEAQKWQAPVLRDNADQSAGKAYGLTSFPYFVVVGADGTVKARATGELTTDQLATLVARATA